MMSQLIKSAPHVKGKTLKMFMLKMVAKASTKNMMAYMGKTVSSTKITASAFAKSFHRGDSPSFA